jgi:hypothetical protein
MAAFCQKCVEGKLDFSAEIYKFFAHPSCAEGSKRLRGQQIKDEVDAVIFVYYKIYLI